MLRWHLWPTNVLQENNCLQEKRKGLAILMGLAKRALIIVDQQNAYKESLRLKLMIFNIPCKQNVGLGLMWSLNQKY